MSLKNEKDHDYHAKKKVELFPNTASKHKVGVQIEHIFYQFELKTIYMRKLLLSLTLLLVIASCSKQNPKEKQPLTLELRQQKINAALNTSNPNRMAIAEKILLASPTPSGYYLKEVVATNKETGLKSLGYIVLKREDSKDQTRGGMVALDWGTYTGWMLYNNGCWYHGTFWWSGDPGNYVFSPDMNPYADNYIGNEPRCMSDAEFDTYV